jgi:hypothetical protein
MTYNFVFKSQKCDFAKRSLNRYANKSHFFHKRSLDVTFRSNQNSTRVGLYKNINLCHLKAYLNKF